jgi:hypothetical protein
VIDDARLAEAFDTLRAHLALIDGASLWVVVVPSHSAEESAAAWIERASVTERSITRLRLTDGGGSLATRLRAHPASPAALILVHDLSLLDAAARHRAIALMNQGREALTEAPHTVVLFVERAHVAELIHVAGDFWSWRSGVTDLGALPSTLWPSTVGDRARLREDYLRALAERTATFELPLPRRYLRRRKGRERSRVATVEAAWRWRVLLQEDVPEPRPVPLWTLFAELEPVLVLGESSTGTNTWLRSLAHDLARVGGERYRSLGLHDGAVPVLIEARAFEAHLAGGDRVAEAVGRTLSMGANARLGEYAREAVEQGHAVLLVERVEEIPTMGRRERLLRALRAACNRSPGIRCIAKALVRSVGGERLRWRRVSLPEPGWRELEHTVRLARSVADVRTPRLNPMLGPEPATDLLRLGLAGDPAFVVHAAVMPGLLAGSRAASARPPLPAARPRSASARRGDPNEDIARVARKLARHDDRTLVPLPDGLDPNAYADSDLLAVEGRRVRFLSRTYFLRALADALPGEMLEGCDEPLLAPAPRQAIEAFGEKLGSGDVRYERVLARRASLAAAVLDNVAGEFHSPEGRTPTPDEARRHTLLFWPGDRRVGEADAHDGAVLEGWARAIQWRAQGAHEAARGAPMVGYVLANLSTHGEAPGRAQGAARLLSSFASDGGVCAHWLRDHVGHPVAEVRATCIEACAGHDLLPLAALSELARAASIEERLAYARGLVARDVPITADDWNWLLSDSSTEVRATALLLLSTRRVPELSRLAIPRLLDPSSDVWTRAASSLRAAFYDDLVPLTAAVCAVAEAAAWTTAETQLALARTSSDPDAVVMIRSLLAHDDASVRRAALETLSHRAAEPLDLAALRPLLTDRADAVRAAAWRYAAHADLPVSSLATETAAAVTDADDVRASLPLALVRGTPLDQPWQWEALLCCIADPVADVSEAASDALYEAASRHARDEPLLRDLADALEALVLAPSWRPYDGARRDLLARRALGALAEALSQLAFERVAADW